MLQAADLATIRAIIARAKRWDLFFSLLGVLSLMVGVLTFTVLFVDMAIQACPGSTTNSSPRSRRAGLKMPASSRPGLAPSWSCW
jgi:hypothetical protein